MHLEDLPVQGKKVLLRVDFNVPFDTKGHISDDTRIQASLPTIRFLLKQGASIIVISHLGRPKGKKDPFLSLKPCAIRLEELLGKKVYFFPDCIGKEVEKIASSLQSGEILFLENLRFYKAEETPKTDPNFAKKLASLADFYVNDAFGAAHRAHSSITEVPLYFKKKSAMGFLMQKELDFLSACFTSPHHPFHAIIGGAKVSSKLGILQSLVKKVDAFFIGGGMAYTFLKAQGYEIGSSLYEESLIIAAKEFLHTTERKNIPLFLPKDLVIAKDFSNNSEKKIIHIEEGIPQGWQGMDIGPLTREDWKNALQKGQMIFWNGPLGVFEFPEFSKGTFSMAHFLANSSAITIIGGGDLVKAIHMCNILQKFSHISTGGGAALELIEHGSLPGIDALYQADVY